MHHNFICTFVLHPKRHLFPDAVVILVITLSNYESPQFRTQDHSSLILRFNVGLKVQDILGLARENGPRHVANWYGYIGKKARVALNGNVYGFNETSRQRKNFAPVSVNTEFKNQHLMLNEIQPSSMKSWESS